MVSQRVSDTGALTAVHLSLVAVLAILTILAIVWGARLKRKRRAADEAEAERVEAEGGNVPSPTEAARPLAEPSARTDNAVADRAAAPVPGAMAPDTSEPARDATTPPPAPPVTEPVAPDAPASADTPIAAAGPLDAAPASEAEPTRADDAAPAPRAAEPIANASSFADEPVTRLKGLGPKVAARLEEHGITTVGQIAVLDATAAERLDARLGPFTGRMVRDRWIEQARFLAAGDRAGYEAVFGKL